MLLYARAANITETDRRSNIIISEIPFDSSYIVIATGPTDFNAKRIFCFCFSLCFSTAFPETFLAGLIWRRRKYALATPFFATRKNMLWWWPLFVIKKAYFPLPPKKSWNNINDYYCNRYVYRSYHDWYVNVGRSVNLIFYAQTISVVVFHGVNKSGKSCEDVRLPEGRAINWQYSIYFGYLDQRAGRRKSFEIYFQSILLSRVKPVIPWQIASVT